MEAVPGQIEGSGVWAPVPPVSESQLAASLLSFHPCTPLLNLAAGQSVDEGEPPSAGPGPVGLDWAARRQGGSDDRGMGPDGCGSECRIPGWTKLIAFIFVYYRDMPGSGIAFKPFGAVSGRGFIKNSFMLLVQAPLQLGLM